MGIADNYSRGRRLLVERPGQALAAVVGVLLVLALFADLAAKLGSGALGVGDVVLLAWRGVVNGLVIGLAGVGLSMTYSILNFANFAHGDYITGGAFVGWAVAWLVAGLGEYDIGSLLSLGLGADVYAPQLGTSIFGAPLALLLGLVAAGVGAIAIALLIDKLVYEPMRGQDGIALLIASIGVAFILRYLIVFVWGTSVTSVADEAGGLRPTVGGVTFSFGYHELTLVVCAVVLMVGVHVLLQRTKLGKAMRAMSDNQDLARVTGIPTERVIKWTWIIGAGLAGVAGYLLILEAGTIAYSRGWILLLLIFAAVILGGIGSVYGAIFGGLVIGLADSMSIIWIPSDFTKAAAFALMILILLFRPSGLFAGRTTA
ncbi:branched-chain amino acid ABC transporter permease [Halobium salinum]|uniref:Branched-chain amino acid ABC transporter permease n=1 Tax=Halobium salinum TaxID=1364940 RepID=A0ABD5PEJ9_9EURY|nr:branched-chain amino acid ABC transporter permease [Halobium salinum]